MMFPQLFADNEHRLTLFVYVHFRNKRKIMRIFTLPPTAGSSPEPNFYDSLQKVRLRQQLEMYSLGEDACGLIGVKLDLALQYCAKVLTRF